MERKIMGGIIALTLGSFAISYEQLYHVAVAAGIPWFMAIIYGFLTEGFITIATMAAVTLSGWARAYAWLVMAAAFGYSLWANADPGSLPSPVVRGVPVVAVPLAVHLGLLMHEAHAARKVAAAAKKEADRVNAVEAREAQVAQRIREVEAYALEVEARAAQVERNASEVANAAVAPVDFSTVSVDDIPEESREVLAARIMARVASTPQARSYWAKKLRELGKPSLTVAIA
ncbi:DUF2637 domain-containing protein [Micromonospora sp. PSH03]|uniref:DUF2637 domain-containing protein n=1 Tax=Micromonospora salmantinae TaxID=2911211 RepID=UPI001EE822C4|nr:DUF2637 domain-containing protein [Micromonospora salmantinae]MCG5459613.1 DUF2637 domain-containing protein [Micromonospora salmantinae]